MRGVVSTAVVASPNADLPRLGILLKLGAWVQFVVVDTDAKWLAVDEIAAYQPSCIRRAGHVVISVATIAPG